jgi:hypothetical protein
MRTRFVHKVPQAGYAQLRDVVFRRTSAKGFHDGVQDTVALQSLCQSLSILTRRVSE